MPEDLKRVLRFPARAALSYLRQHERGDVVFISSAGAQRFVPGGAPYSMGKAAVEALAHTLAIEARKNGIHVNVVAPGLVDTDGLALGGRDPGRLRHTRVSRREPVRPRVQRQRRRAVVSCCSWSPTAPDT
jgi:NAD(P)-dependent dehydrogenase (short-subunit alcohol dehydrogenase family)